jgi:NADP-reducing hydrogenase subunit HndB
LQKLNIEKLRALNRDLQARKRPKAIVVVHMGTCGIASGAEEVRQAILDAANDMDRADVEIRTSGCAGFCSREPMLTVWISGSSPVKYCEVNAAKARRIYAEHVLGGKPVGEYALCVGSESMH